MAIKAGEIYFTQKAVFGKSTYGRPILILRVRGNTFHAAPFSTKINLAEPGDLVIRTSDEGFDKTGLSEDSCLLHDRDFGGSLDFLKNADFMGAVFGPLKLRVEKWWGEPLA